MFLSTVNQTVDNLSTQKFVDNKITFDLTNDVLRFLFNSRAFSVDYNSWDLYSTKLCRDIYSGKYMIEKNGDNSIEDEFRASYITAMKQKNFGYLNTLATNWKKCTDLTKPTMTIRNKFLPQKEDPSLDLWAIARSYDLSNSINIESEKKFKGFKEKFINTPFSNYSTTEGYGRTYTYVTIEGNEDDVLKFMDKLRNEAIHGHHLVVHSTFTAF